MKSEKILSWLIIAVICSLFLAAGCEPASRETAEIKIEPEKQIAEPPEKAIEKEVEKPVEEEVAKATVKGPVTLALKFRPFDLTTYRLIIETERSVKFKDPVPNRTAKRVEMTFSQRIRSVNDKGNAIAQIIIQDLKYSSVVKNAPLVDFDNSREKDRHNPMGRLIGEGYTIEIAPGGQIVDVADFLKAQFAIRSDARPGKAAVAFVQPNAIRERHELVALPDADKNHINITDNWSRLKTFSYDMMGSKSHEKIYTLKEVEDLGNRQVAVVEMEAIPSAEMARQLHKEESDPFSQMADSSETYTGRLRLDLTAGKVEEFVEKLESKWVIVDPSAKGRKNPATLIMRATHLYSLEKID